jgi:hypothetical protein
MDSSLFLCKDGLLLFYLENCCLAISHQDRFIKQPILIQTNLCVLGIHEYSNKKTTHLDSFLPTDINHLEHIETWPYRSIIGTLFAWSIILILILV